MRIAITGAKGLLGQELNSHFRSCGFEVWGLDRKELDITDGQAASKVLKEIQPDLIINCAAMVNVDECEEKPELAYAVNRDGVKNLIEAAIRITPPPTFIQISSSEVFGGWEEGEYKIGGYGEDDECRSISVYQKSKKEAEDLVMTFGQANPEKLKRWYIVRASWLYGQGRETFVEQFRDALLTGRELVLAQDQWRSPTWTLDFARRLEVLIQGEYPNGIYHIANEVKSGEATAMDVVEEICSGLGIKLKEAKLKLVSRREFFKVPRAASNVLLNTKLPKLRYWREAIREYLRERYLANPPSVRV